jgi:membrane-associated phospholipid phosphatase
LLALLTPALSGAADDSSQRLQWNPRWRSWQLVDTVTTSAMLAGSVYIHFGLDRPTDANWTEPILMDEAVHDAFRTNSRSGRNLMITVGDVLFYVAPTVPFIDSVLTPTLTDHGNTEIAFQLTAMNIQAISLSFVLVEGAHRFIARERPDVEGCSRDPDYHMSCGAKEFSSFPAGHCAAVATAAGLMCAHHSRLPLWGSPAADSAACVLMVVASLGTAFARMLSERHWATDSIVGGAVGYGVGYGMPTLLHYTGWSISPSLTQTEIGLTVGGEL